MNLIDGFSLVFNSKGWNLNHEGKCISILGMTTAAQAEEFVKTVRIIEQPGHTLHKSVGYIISTGHDSNFKLLVAPKEHSPWSVGSQMFLPDDWLRPIVQTKENKQTCTCPWDQLKNRGCLCLREGPRYVVPY